MTLIPLCGVALTDWLNPRCFLKEFLWGQNYYTCHKELSRTFHNVLFFSIYTTIIYSAYFFAGIFQPEYLSFDYRTAFTIYRIILTFRTYNTTATDNFIHILTIPLYKREVVYFFIFDFGVGNSLYIAWNKPVKNSLLSTSSTNSISFAPS